MLHSHTHMLHPPLASVGLQEEAATKQGLHFRINKASTASWYSSRRIGEKYSGFKVLIEEDTDRVLGAHIFGPHAEYYYTKQVFS